MVIGLNGRIPLNTAGNLAGTGKTHAQHLGNSVSEIDPTYGLQNAFVFGQRRSIRSTRCSTERSQGSAVPLPARMARISRITPR